MFSDLDVSGDTVVLRMQFMQKLRNEMSVIRMLHEEASYLGALGKTLNLDKVLCLIE